MSPRGHRTLSAGPLTDVDQLGAYHGRHIFIYVPGPLLANLLSQPFPSAHVMVLAGRSLDGDPP